MNQNNIASATNEISFHFSISRWTEEQKDAI